MLGSAGGITVLLPWLCVGALGGRLESVLALLAAAGCGWLAAEVLQPLWNSYAATPRRAGMVIVAGLVAAVALVPLGAAYGASGPHLAQTLGLPLLGIAGAALARWGAGRPTIGALIGCAALGPLALVEADETSVLLGLHEVGYWAAIGGLCSMGAALVLAIVALATVRLRGEGGIGGRAPLFRRTKAGVFAASTALALAAVGAIVVYPLAGHPGFFGERVFVVMKTQADLSGLDQITDLTQRREQTYRRLVEEADATQKSLRAELTRKHLKFTPYYLVNGILVDDGSQARIWLSRRGDVDRVLLNPTLRPIPAAAAPMRGSLADVTSPLWNISMIGAPQVWASGDTGQGVVIGSSDTGVDLAHPALTASYRGGDDSWYDPWNGTTTPVDHDGHGTHTMGSALGSGGIGVAPGAQWMGCVNLDRDMGNPALLPGLPAVHAGAVRAGRQRVRGQSGTGRRHPHQLVGLPRAGRLRPDRTGAGRERAHHCRDLLRRRRRQRRTAVRLDRRRARALCGLVHGRCGRSARKTRGLLQPWAGRRAVETRCAGARRGRGLGTPGRRLRRTGRHVDGNAAGGRRGGIDVVGAPRVARQHRSHRADPPGHLVHVCQWLRQHGRPGKCRSCGGRSSIITHFRVVYATQLFR